MESYRLWAMTPPIPQTSHTYSPNYTGTHNPAARIKALERGLQTDLTILSTG